MRQLRAFSMRCKRVISTRNNDRRARPGLASLKLDSSIRPVNNGDQLEDGRLHIDAWLRSIGFGQYEAAFRDNAIDVDLLPDLTDDDLEKLGLPLGHRAESR